MGESPCLTAEPHLLLFIIGVGQAAQIWPLGFGETSIWKVPPTLPPDVGHG